MSDDKKPAIRFKNYSDDWEQRKFGEITELKSASRVHKDEWTSNGVPFYRSSDVMAAINGTENEKVFISEELYEKLSKVSGKLEEGDILVTGGGSVGNPYIVPDNKPLYTKDADLLWIKNKGKFHSYFLYEFFFSPTFRNYLGSISHVGTIAHYTITQLSDTPICLPSFEEQKKVGEYFQSLDNLITLHHRKYDKLQNLKKAMLEKMFPKNGSNVPEIRFKGFTDDWEQRKLGELGSLKNGMNFSKEAMGIGFPFVNLQNIFGNNVIDVTNLGKAMASDSQLKDYNLLNGDVLFVRSSVKLEGVGEAALVPQNLENTTYSGFIIRFRDEYGLDNNFKRFIFGIESVRNQIMAQATNSANKNISQTVLENLCLKIPNKSEQEKIGLYFSNLDKLITLHQRELEKLKNVKKAMLEKMFV